MLLLNSKDPDTKDILYALCHPSNQNKIVDHNKLPPTKKYRRQFYELQTTKCTKTLYKTDTIEYTRYNRHFKLNIMYQRLDTVQVITVIVSEQRPPQLGPLSWSCVIF